MSTRAFLWSELQVWTVKNEPLADGIVGVHVDDSSQKHIHAILEVLLSTAKHEQIYVFIGIAAFRLLDCVRIQRSVHRTKGCSTLQR